MPELANKDLNSQPTEGAIEAALAVPVKEKRLKNSPKAGKRGTKLPQKRRKEDGPHKENSKSSDNDDQQPQKERKRKRKRILEPVDGDVAQDSIAVFLKQPHFRESEEKQEREMSYMISLALIPLKDCTSSEHLFVIRTHLNGLQPQLQIKQLAKSLLFFYVRNNCSHTLERPLLALIRLLAASQWPQLETAVVDAVPDCLTVQEGPPVGNLEAEFLGHLAGWLSIIQKSRGHLLAMMSEILGRGGPRAGPLCLGVLKVWPAALGKGLLDDCVRHAIWKLVEEKPFETSDKLCQILENYLKEPPPSLDEILENLEAAFSRAESPAVFGALLLARIYGPKWSQKYLLETILNPISMPDDGVNAASQAVHTMGFIGHSLGYGRRSGCAAARRTITTSVLKALELDHDLAEAAATAFVATYGAGRPLMLKRCLQRIPAEFVGEQFKLRLEAWGLKNLEPMFRLKNRERREADQEVPEDNQIFNLKFPETVKELFFDDYSTTLLDDELRFPV
ncbi:uncharacterized protein LOC132205512 [Neocloeon triangulifer]|uniref:uncharacterized protein LOC132205512 n=1 Tax=Neocloeon triangulifer TaxID=2078957 RepID=UPI00286FAE4D|nr:uncharacterized protein LOC132205512 [Neocloeon triangulifer]XP_059490586.1 uncharacterized protein LOC132205512 [Neocloeon triangulifer]XP_059490587.1 uncharacterized protein LOC132205512 [Neocloeon triangulifer]XP_059490588.1 uncharacterized protein LOC132205512 [Neocloeon triangulifer]